MKKLLIGLLAFGSLSGYSATLDCSIMDQSGNQTSKFSIDPMKGTELHINDNYVARGNSSPPISLNGFVYVVSSTVILDPNNEIQMQNVLVSRRKYLNKDSSLKNIKMEQVKKDEFWNGVIPKELAYSLDNSNLKCKTRN